MPWPILSSPINCQNVTQSHLFSSNLLPWFNSSSITCFTPKWSSSLLPIPQDYPFKPKSDVTPSFKKFLKCPSLPPEWLSKRAGKVLPNRAPPTFQAQPVQPHSLHTSVKVKQSCRPSLPASLPSRSLLTWLASSLLADSAGMPANFPNSPRAL